MAGVSGSADGTGATAQFNQPQGVVMDGAGNVYVADTGNHTIRQITPAGAVSTLAGVAGVSGSSDGTGSSAQFDYPAGLAADHAGSLYVADTGNNTLRQGAWITTGPPTITSQPQDQIVSQGADAAFVVIASGSAPLRYQWSLYGTNLAGATGSSYTRINAQPADAGPYSVVVTNTLGTATSSNALLAVIVPPTITTQPQSQTVNQGTSPTFIAGLACQAAGNHRGGRPTSPNRTLPHPCALLSWLWGGFGVALGSHWGGFVVAFSCLVDGFVVALGWL